VPTTTVFSAPSTPPERGADRAGITTGLGADARELACDVGVVVAVFAEFGFTTNWLGGSPRRQMGSRPTVE